MQSPVEHSFQSSIHTAQGAKRGYARQQVSASLGLNQTIVTRQACVQRFRTFHRNPTLALSPGCSRRTGRFYVYFAFRFRLISLPSLIVLAVSGDVANIESSVPWWNYAWPNLVGNPHPANPTAQEWFNPAAFEVPSFSYGNLGRNVLRTPSSSMQTSLCSKTFW
jgi:hypothetical protein